LGRVWLHPSFGFFSCKNGPPPSCLFFFLFNSFINGTVPLIFSPVSPVRTLSLRDLLIEFPPGESQTFPPVDAWALGLVFQLNTSCHTPDSNPPPPDGDFLSCECPGTRFPLRVFFSPTDATTFMSHFFMFFLPSLPLHRLLAPHNFCVPNRPTPFLRCFLFLRSPAVFLLTIFASLFPTPTSPFHPSFG